MLAAVLRFTSIAADAIKYSAWIPAAMHAAIHSAGNA
jgi:hypothetical protein